MSNLALRVAQFWDTHPALDNLITERAYDAQQNGKRFTHADIYAILCSKMTDWNGLTPRQLAKYYGSIGW